ncbi:MAG: FAD-binding oxidoreductase [SAR202 cluster bacterium]|nr:FAD-binding oxidoreductase [SAR202 cluster bacterium]
MDSVIVNDLRKLIPSMTVSSRPSDVKSTSSDALSFHDHHHWEKLQIKTPKIVVRPTTTQEIATLARYASDRTIPLVPRGGGTGVMGAAIPTRGGILIDLRGLNSIEMISKENHLVVVQAGVVLESLSHSLTRHSLLLGHDPWSLPIATVGGAISTNGMGYLASKYGSMGSQVIGLEIVLPTGEVLPPSYSPKSAGPALKHLFIGSEGCLGIITRAVLEVFPIPEAQSLDAFMFPSFEHGFQVIQEFQSLGINPSVVDFAEEFSKSTGQWETKLFLGFHGIQSEVMALKKRSHFLCQRNKGQALPLSEASSFWETRHQSGERYKREVLDIPPGSRPIRRIQPMDYLHVSIPVSNILEYRQECQRLLDLNGFPVKEWSIWARPEFFSLLLTDNREQAGKSATTMTEVVDVMLTMAQDYGGTMEYCHGVGLKRAHLMKREIGPGLKTLDRIKRTLDPANVMNPGKLGLD